MKDREREIIRNIVQVIYDKKGFNILVMDVRGISTMADYFIIAEGTVDRHVKALYSNILDELDKANIHPYRTEGMKSPEWVVMDYGEIIVHLLIPEMREKYALEKLWNQATIVDVPIKISKEFPPA